MSLHASVELRQVLAEAEDIATQVSQRLTTAHLLLGLFTLENRAKILLNEKGIDEDTLLEYVHTTSNESPDAVRSVKRKASEIAAGAGAPAVDCLHLLVAICGIRHSVAFQLLEKSGLSVTQFRNMALSYVTSGYPRRLTVKKRSSKGRLTPRAEASVNLSSPPAKARSSSIAPVVERGPVDEDGRPEIGLPLRPALESTGLEQDDGPYAEAVEDGGTATVWDLAPTQFPILSKLGRNLTALASLGELDPLVGRAKELDEVIDTLLKRRANNPLLVGEPGVGKTAIVEGLALKIASDSQDAHALADRKVVELDVASLLAGTQLRGAFSEKLQHIRNEVRKADGEVIVFFDEMHTLMGAGSTGDGPQDAANELKASLARGEFPCIGATTYDEYRKFIEQDPALARRFQLIQVPEPSNEATLEILTGIAQEYADHHGVKYDSDALDAAVALSSRYITDRCLPDKAISLLDLAGSRARRSGKDRVDREAVARVVSSVAGIPVDRLLMTDAERLLNMEQILGLQIIGHTTSIRSIAKVIRRNYAGFAHRRPIGSFLFLGPTGVGKTETARALAQFLYGSKDALVKLDMSEYIESHTVSRLLGSPPGYVGHAEGGQLTEAVRRKPYTTVLFDEVEKAHPEVQQIMLQILDEGRLTDARGRTVDFTNTVVIMTSNQGSDTLGRPGPQRIGFGNTDNVSSVDLARDVLSAARKHFPPELWGRMDEHLFFRPLTGDDLCGIAGLLITESADRLAAERNMHVQAEQAVYRHLVEQGCEDFSLGARPLRSAVRRMIEEPLAEAILAGQFDSGDHILVKLEDSSLVFAREQ